MRRAHDLGNGAMRRSVALPLLLCCGFAAAELASPPSAVAFNPIKPICSAAGWVSGLVGKACNVVQHAGSVVQAGKKLVTGHVGSAAKTLLGGGGGSSSLAAHTTTVIGLAAIGAWVLGGARFALHETAKVLSNTTTPQLRSTWFSSTYWRMAGIAVMLTLPFLFAAAVQALMRSDLTLLARAAFGYLPLAMLGVGVAAPLTMLLLVASDQLSAVVSAAAGNASTHFLEFTGTVVGVLTVFSGSPFLAFLVGAFTAAATLALWLELLVREAAVYVIVLMLPLAFAALVWPARRIWAIRVVELLVALILSKFAIVAVLSLGGAAIAGSVGGHSITGAVAGGALVLLAAFAPWALLRLLPLTELAGGAAGSLRNEVAAGAPGTGGPESRSDRVENWLAHMRDQALDTSAPEVRPNGDACPTLAGACTEPSEPEEAGAPVAAQAWGSEQRSNGAGAEEPPHEEPNGSHGEERLPGMDSIWQMRDGEWEPIVLGPEVSTAEDADRRPPVQPGAEEPE